jgi:two-component system NtrC family sensor kinase
MVQDVVRRGCPYAVAFVDMRMPPGWDGVETIEHLWQVDPALQVVICTAYSDHSWDHIITRIGGRDNLLVLRKPFDPIEVWQLASALTQKWHLAQQAQMQFRALEQLIKQRTGELQLIKEVAEARKCAELALQAEIAERKKAETAREEILHNFWAPIHRSKNVRHNCARRTVRRHRL